MRVTLQSVVNQTQTDLPQPTIERLSVLLLRLGDYPEETQTALLNGVLRPLLGFEDYA